eukprot:TRINITY_DN2839_c0_g1_i1.p2 TRINITY_DN2839_c0_g1~~TRINITY_DN2839_c0_g1_i1.p2  ORF type:complete len:275 (+),score=59.73 TRINITY_DN2839_c0_g1_i1:53-877(+)
MSSAYLRAMHGAKAKTVFETEGSELTISYDDGKKRGSDQHRRVSAALVSNRHQVASSKYALDAQLHNGEMGASSSKESSSSSRRQDSRGRRAIPSGIELPDQDSGRSRHGGGRRGRERARDEAQREQRADAYRTLRDDPDYRDMIDAYRRSRHPEDALAAARYAVEKKVPAEAEKHFRAALEYDPDHIPTLSTYGLYLETVVRDFDRAETMLQAAALSGRPQHIRAYANFLRDIRGDDKLADKVLNAAAAAASTDGAAGDDSRRRRRHRGERRR